MEDLVRAISLINDGDGVLVLVMVMGGVHGMSE